MKLLACCLCAGLLAALAAGCGGSKSASVESHSPTNSGPSKRQAEQKFGAKPGVTEYRVHADLNLNLGKGVSGSVNGSNSFKCVNGNGGFPFNTATDQEKHDLWIDASESVVPPCFQDASYQYFDVNIYGPYQGKLSNIRLGQDQAGHPYTLQCGGDTGRVGCREKGPLAIEITCIPPANPRDHPCVKEPGPP